MATVVQYGGVKLYNVLTRKWEQEIFYDSSGTDAIGHKYSLTFEGILHMQRVPLNAGEVYIEGDTASPNVFSLLERVRLLLMRPREKLTVTVAGITVIEVEPPKVGQGNTKEDIDNGPKPKNISVTILGSNAFRVSFSVDAIVGACGSNVSVLSNRWRLSETMDSNFHITRTINGKLRISKGMVQAGKGTPIHHFKGTIIPPLESSFRRDRMTFTAEEDGLTATYEVVDRQVHHAAPWPATSMNATHTEMTQHGTFFVSEMRVRLQGDPAVDKRLLLERAMQIIEARLHIEDISSKNRKASLESYIITDHIGEHSVVEISARVRRVDAIASSMKLGLVLNELGKELKLNEPIQGNRNVRGAKYSSQESRVPKTYGFKASSNLPDWERRPAVLF